MSDRAGVALIEELRALRLAAGKPSSRAIANRVPDGMSHTTVNEYVNKGSRIASWPVTEAIVVALESFIPDSEAETAVPRIRDLWAAAQAEGHYAGTEPAESADPALPPARYGGALLGELREIRQLLERVVEHLDRER